MKCIHQYRAKTAVWKAAIGEVSDLADLLRSDQPIPPAAREQLALLIEGKLVGKRKSRGRPVPETSPSLGIAEVVFSKVARALLAYEAEAEALKREGMFRGNAEQLEERIASEFGITLAALQNAKKNPNRIKKLAPYQSDDAAPFRRWLADRDVVDGLVPKKRAD